MERRPTRDTHQMMYGAAIAIGLFAGCSVSTDQPIGHTELTQETERASIDTPRPVPAAAHSLAQRPTASLLDHTRVDVLPVSFESEEKRPSNERSIQFSTGPTPTVASTPKLNGKVSTRPKNDAAPKSTPQIPPTPDQIADLPIEVERFFLPLKKRAGAAKKSSNARAPTRRFKSLAADGKGPQGIKFNEMDVLQLKANKSAEDTVAEPEVTADEKESVSSAVSTIPADVARPKAVDVLTPAEDSPTKGPLWDIEEIQEKSKIDSKELVPEWTEDVVDATQSPSTQSDLPQEVIVESNSGPTTIINPFKTESDDREPAQDGVHDPSFGSLSDALAGSDGRRRFQNRNAETETADTERELKQAFKAILSKPNQQLPSGSKLEERAPEVPPNAPPEPASSLLNSPPEREVPLDRPAADAGLPTRVQPDITDGLPLSASVRQSARAKLRIVTQQANRHIRYAFDLGRKGAIYSARAEFVKALRIVAHSLDEAYATNDRGQSLTDGLKALEEAEDFMLRDAALSTSLDVAAIVSGHETKIIKESDASRIGPFRAIQAYYEYAKERLAYAGGKEPAASIAIYGLARTESRIAGDESVLGGPKAIALHQAAVLVDPNNYLAANQLGVLFAKYGQLERAKLAFTRSLEIKSHHRTWQNLSVVSARLGDENMAARASHNARQGLSVDRPAQVADTRVQWVDAATFQARSGADPVLARRPQTVQPSNRPVQNAKVNDSKFFKLPFGVRAKSNESQRTINR